MSPKLFLLFLLTICFFFLVNSAPIETENEAQDNTNIEKTYNELQDLKRVVRQCPFSGGAGGAGPDLNQMISIARTILSALDGGAAGGAGGFGGVPGISGANPAVDTNALGRLRRRF